ncbi:MAG: hypothetical protein ACFBZ9_03415 [Sphingomonadales bacterium]
MTPDEKQAFLAQRDGRNKAIGFSLAGVALLFFLVTIVKLGVI